MIRLNLKTEEHELQANTSEILSSNHTSHTQ